jgi:hypothetical protein
VHASPHFRRPRDDNVTGEGEIDMSVKMRGLAALLIVVTIAMLSGGTSNAAEITCLKKYGGNLTLDTAEKRALALKLYSGHIPTAETCTEVLIKGTIIAGDSVKFAQIVKQSHPFLNRILLWSSGGSVEEAMKIGRLVRKGLIDTKAPYHLNEWPAGYGRLFPDTTRPDVCANNTDCHCASACFLIWVGGVDREGDLLGLHRPSARSTTFASMPPDRAAVYYRELLAEVAKYLTDMEVAPRFTEIMTDTSSRDIRWLTFDEAYGMSKAPSIAEWLASTCGALSKSELYKMASSGLKVAIQKKGTLQERQLLDQLQKRSYEIQSCEIDKIEQARQAIKELAN